MGKLPAFQFYTGDWLKDPALRSVSSAARGLWIDLLCLMSECVPRGYLSMNGRTPSPDQIARMTGLAAGEVPPLLTELESAGVFSRDRHGSIYSRRMVRDEEIRQGNRVRQMRCRAKPNNGNPRVTAMSHASSSSITSSDVPPNPQRGKPPPGGVRKRIPKTPGRAPDLPATGKTPPSPGEDSPPPVQGRENAWDWPRIAETLKGAIDAESFDAWIAPLRCLGMTRDAAWLEVPTAFFRSWLRSNHEGQIADAMQAKTGVEPQIFYVINDQSEETEG